MISVDWKRLQSTTTAPGTRTTVQGCHMKWSADCGAVTYLLWCRRRCTEAHWRQSSLISLPVYPVLFYLENGFHFRVFVKESFLGFCLAVLPYSVSHVNVTNSNVVRPSCTNTTVLSFFARSYSCFKKATLQQRSSRRRLNKITSGQTQRRNKKFIN